MDNSDVKATEITKDTPNIESIIELAEIICSLDEPRRKLVYEMIEKIKSDKSYIRVS